MDDLIAFLTARLDEAKRDAPSVHLSDCGCVMDISSGSCDCGYPARVLREVATWRAILAQAAAGPPADRPGFRAGFNAALGFVLQAAAGEYSDHPDWRMDGCWGRAASEAVSNG
jgi:hypothetical protein